MEIRIELDNFLMNYGRYVRECAMLRQQPDYVVWNDKLCVLFNQWLEEQGAVKIITDRAADGEYIPVDYGPLRIKCLCKVTIE